MIETAADYIQILKLEAAAKRDIGMCWHCCGEIPAGEHSRTFHARCKLAWLNERVDNWRFMRELRGRREG